MSYYNYPESNSCQLYLLPVVLRKILSGALVIRPTIPSKSRRKTPRSIVYIYQTQHGYIGGAVSMGDPPGVLCSKTQSL